MPNSEQSPQKPDKNIDIRKTLSPWPSRTASSFSRISPGPFQSCAPRPYLPSENDCIGALCIPLKPRLGIFKPGRLNLPRAIQKGVREIVRRNRRPSTTPRARRSEKITLANEESEKLSDLDPEARLKCIKIAVKAALKSKFLSPLESFLITDLGDVAADIGQETIRAIANTVRSWASYELREYLSTAGADSTLMKRSDLVSNVESHLVGDGR